MALSLRTPRDRPGHPWFLLVVLLLWVPSTALAAPGNYKAQRFDVLARAARGDLVVTESIVFEFQSGTFTKVWRDIPASRTDGIQILDASMDGVAMTPGAGPGHVTISGRNRVRVEWQFAETSASVHRFDLHYIARGVVYQDGGADVVRWRALPAEHRYRIDASRIQFEPAEARVAPPEAHRVGSVTVHPSSEAVSIEASGIQSDGWIVAELRYPAGTLTQAQPDWYVRQAGAVALAPKWAMAGGAIFIAAILLASIIRGGYPAPGGIANETLASEPPQPLPVALAAVLAARGRMSSHQGMGTLLDLADRGVLTIREVPGVLGVRGYEVCQVTGSHDLDAHETEALTIAFGGRGDDVSLAKARGRLARQARRFSHAVNGDLAALGLLDPVRKAARDRLTAVAFGMLLLGALGMVAASPLIPRYEAWPFLLPAGLMAAGIVSIIIAASMTPLSDQGLVEAARWRGFKRHLKTLASNRDEADARVVPSRWIVYAVALGLGSYWSRHLKRHPGVVPPWFLAAGGDDGAAFAVFVGSHAASGTGGGATGGGAAGGGGSGAG